MTSPLVSICCICYNQEQYIRQTLEGFVEQKTTFPYEIIVSDDCSTDRTSDIINEYKIKYPGLFRDVSPSYNIGYIENWWYVQRCSHAKYIAMCEGDDFWIDVYKLQKQIDILECHPEYSMCVTNRKVLLNDGTYYIDVQDWKLKDNKDVLRGFIPHTQTLVYRNSESKLRDCDCIRLTTSKGGGDRALAWHVSKYGEIYNLPDVTAVYRLGCGLFGASVDDPQLELNKINSYVDFQHQILIPDRKIYVESLSKFCLNYLYYSYKRKIHNEIPYAKKSFLLWRKELSTYERIRYMLLFIKSKIIKRGNSVL